MLVRLSLFFFSKNHVEEEEQTILNILTCSCTSRGLKAQCTTIAKSTVNIASVVLSGFQVYGVI